VDTVAEAIEDAKLNATLNQINNASFFAGDVIKVCQDSFFAQHGHPDVVIIDPPRAGCHDTLIQKLLELQSPKIVYVSCNPATQARDVALLAGRYDVQKSQAVDMFPHTHHVENVLLLTLKSI
jgi:23S rRNA (uracil1939-C5)-methyltransferase